MGLIEWVAVGIAVAAVMAAAGWMAGGWIRRHEELDMFEMPEGRGNEDDEDER